MDCFCAKTTKKIIQVKGKFSKEINSRLSSAEIAILNLIFQDLACRNEQNRLSYQNFLDFFDLTGLWGLKLFEQFDEDKMGLISFEEFLYGISQTAKAPFDQKIKLLYLFFQKQINSGIQFKKFVKMVQFVLVQLYNYSKQQLKEILIQDGLIKSSNDPVINQNEDKNSPIKIVELSVQSPEKQPSTAFQKTYRNLLEQNHDQGTYFEISENELKYKIKYYNMQTLIKQFAEKVYFQHGIDVQKDHHKRLSYQNFSNWIKSHKKLYKSYYSSFHQQIWEVVNDEPSYLYQQIDMEFNGKIQCGKLRCEVYGFQIEDIIIFCQSKKNKRKPIKFVCLEGLTIIDIGNMKIEISHRSDCYANLKMIFDKQNEYKDWLKNLSIYQRQSINQNYIVSEVIGTGRYSIVYKCIQKQTNKIYALKVIEYEKLTKTAREAISNESEILKVLNHHQILKYIDTLFTKTHQYIITEYIYGEDLYQYVKKRKFLNQFESAFIIGNIMNAVIYLHDLEIMHRDLKPENIMVMFKEKKQGEYFQCTTPHIRKGQRIQNIKIIDFGLSNHISNLQKLDPKKLAAGTPNYIAPELLFHQKGPLTLKSDVFSIGSILYFLLSGRLPFAELDIQKTLLNTVAGDYDITSQHWEHISFQAKDLIRKLLEYEPEHRIDLKQAINHDWFNKISCKNVESNASSVSDNSQNKINCTNFTLSQQKPQKLQDIERKRKISNSLNKDSNRNWC